MVRFELDPVPSDLFAAVASQKHAVESVSASRAAPASRSPSPPAKRPKASSSASPTADSSHGRRSSTSSDNATLENSPPPTIDELGVQINVLKERLNDPSNLDVQIEVAEAALEDSGSRQGTLKSTLQSLAEVEKQTGAELAVIEGQERELRKRSVQMRTTLEDIYATRAKQTAALNSAEEDVDADEERIRMLRRQKDRTVIEHREVKIELNKLENQHATARLNELAASLTQPKMEGSQSMTETAEEMNGIMQKLIALEATQESLEAERAAEV